MTADRFSRRRSLRTAVMVSAVAMLGVLSGCGSDSPSAASDDANVAATTTTVAAKPMRGERYCEALLITIDAGSATGAVWNTYPLNTCPQVVWDTLDPKAIAAENVSLLTKVPGVGKKTAERLVIELRDKIGKVDSFRLLPASALTLGATAPAEPATPSEEAESALVALGYKPAEAARAVKAVAAGIDDTAELVRAALKGLMKP